MSSQKATFSEVIRNRGFKYLWINQVLMQLAINTLNFALIIWVYKLTDSNFAVSALILSVYIPAFLFGLFAGVLVDITDKRKLIILLDLFFAAAFFLFPFIKGSFPLILVNAFLINSLAQFFMPAEGSSIPLLAKKNQLFVANSLFSFTLYGSFMIGFTLAGPILNLYSINPVFYLGGFLLIIGAFISRKLPKLQVKRPASDKKILAVIGSETRETLRFIKGKLPIAISIGLLAAVQGVIGVLAVLVPSYMERILHVHATDASLFLMLPLGLGMVVGALVIGKFFHSVPRRVLVIPAIIIAGLLLFGVGVAPDIARALDATELPSRIRHLRYFFNAPSLASSFAVGAFLLGLSAVAIIIPSQTVLQEHTNDQNRGKIFAVLAVMMNTFAAIPVALAGVFSDLFGVRPIFISLGTLVFIIGILAMKPAIFIGESLLPFGIKEFLGLGHWEKHVSKDT
jgi:MFS family permease